MIYLVDTVGETGDMTHYNRKIQELFQGKGYQTLILSNYKDKDALCFFHDFYQGAKPLIILRLLFSFVKYIYYVILRYRSIQLLIYQSYGLRMIDMLFIAPLALSGKHLVIVHDVYDLRYSGNYCKRAFQGIFYRFFFRNILVHSEKAKLELRTLGYKGRLFEMPHPKIRLSYEYEESKVAKEVKIAVANDKVNLLFFGSIRKTKGLDVFTESLNYLDEKYINRINIIIAGRDKENVLQGAVGNLHRDLKLNIINRKINDDEMKYLFLSCDAVVMPYTEIYQSAVLDVAYNFKKPVIASNHQIIVDEINRYKFGLIFENRNALDMSEKIKDFLDKRTPFFFGDDELRKEYYNDKKFDSLFEELKKSMLAEIKN